MFIKVRISSLVNAFNQLRLTSPVYREKMIHYLCINCMNCLICLLVLHALQPGQNHHRDRQRILGPPSAVSWTNDIQTTVSNVEFSIFPLCAVMCNPNTVEQGYLKLGYLKLLTLSNSNQFPSDILFQSLN